MRSASFRFLSTVIWLLLLLALILTIVVVVRDNPPGTQSVTAPTQRKTSATEQPEAPVEESSAIRPTFTSTPVVPKATVLLLDTKRILAGGFSFRPVDGYSLEIADGSATMAAPDADPALGPSLLLIGGPDSSLIQADTESIDHAFDQFVDSFAKDGGFEVGPQESISTKRLTGVTAALSNQKATDGTTGRPFAGRIFMARPNPPQFFVMIAIAPTNKWEAKVANEFNAVLDTVDLFNLTAQFGRTVQPSLGLADTVKSATGQPLAESPTSESTRSADTLPTDGLSTDALPTDAGVEESTANSLVNSASGDALSGNNTGRLSDRDASSDSSQQQGQQRQWRSYTNSNVVNKALTVGNTIWTATDGGVVAWNQSSSSASKFTTADGLLANSSTSIALCEFTNLGVVVGTAVGLQVFHLDSGRWTTLDSNNSLMSYDDVSDLYCDSNYGFMVIGYQRHGIEIFDANRDEWIHFDRNRALVSNVVRQLAVVGDRKEVWIVSDIGITVLENIPELDNRRSSFFNNTNSPLQEKLIDAIVTASDGSIWISQENAVYNVRITEQSVAGSTQREWSTYDANAISEEFTGGFITSIAATTDQTVWLGNQDADLCRFDPDSESCVQLMNAGQQQEQDNDAQLSHLFTDNAENLYYTTRGDGIFYLDGNKWRQLSVDDEPITDNTIQHLTQDSDGYIWIATSDSIQLAETSPELGSELDRLVVNESATERVRRGNPILFDGHEAGQLVAEIWGDATGQIWIGTESASSFDGENWSSYSSLNGIVGTPIQAFALDNQDRIWIGTGGGLNILNDETFFSLTKAQGLPDDNIQAIIADLKSPENIVWIGTATGGLLRFEKNQLQVFNQSSANLPSNNVTALGFDQDGSLLIGTDNGLARLVGGRAIKIRAIGDTSVTTIATTSTSSADADISVWVGTEGSGVFYFNGIGWVQLPPEQVPDRHVTSILIDKDGIVWLGGAAGGLMQHSIIEN